MIRFKSISTVLLLAGFSWCCAATLAQQAASPLAEANSPNEQLVPESNPAVLAALELPRTKPTHYLSAVLALVDLKRPELAAPILQELIELNLSDEQQAALVAEFGSHRMLQLARTAALAPAGQEFAEASMTAAAARSRDPQRIAQLIDQLTAPTASSRTAARLDLAAAGEVGVVAALEALARETDPQRRRAIATAIVYMDPAAVDPLLGMLTTSDRALRRDVIRILKAMQVTLAKPFIATESSTTSAVKLLDEAIGRHRRGMRLFVADENNTVALWQWNDASKKLSATRCPVDDAHAIWAARLALEYAKVRPDQRLVHCQALVLGLEAEGLVGAGRTSVIEKLLVTADGDMLNLVLHSAMKHDLPRAAVASAEVIGARGDIGALFASSPNPAPLAEALVYPNRRVRFAALSAIMALDPQSPFPGASRLPETLGYFATSASGRRAVVAMSNSGHASTLAGRLAELGIEADAANRGGAAVAAAQQSADLEMVLVDVDIDGPGIRDVLYALRTTSATGQIPIGLLAHGDRLDVAHRLANEHQRVVAFPRPQSAAALEELVARLEGISGRDPVTPQDRAKMAGAALNWLGNLLARENTFYDLHRQAPIVEAALYLPALTERSVATLELLGTPASQRSLVDFASHLNIPMKSRRQAAQAFAMSVQRHGVLLTEAEILRQYDRYNASESLDADTQQVFGTVLDAIESLRAQADAAQLFPATYTQ